MNNQAADVQRSATWEGDEARLDRVVAELDLARSRSRAGELIAAGAVTCDGVLAKKAGVKVTAGVEVTVTGEDRFVSRGAHKLVAAIAEFGLEPQGRVTMDLGASTGGFTQVLLEHDPKVVLAIDVGHDQMVPAIAADPRVRSIEGCNARELTAERLAELTGQNEKPSLIVADLSFISLTHILPAIARCASDDAEAAVLVKPQFEVGRVRNGIVLDPAQWESAIRTVMGAAAEHGFMTRGIAPSPILGGEGNREFLLWIARGTPGDQTEWDARITELCTVTAERSGAATGRTN
ncbi:TlyA family RNA methyltransferase [Leucobacter sp. cx-328]|uniref:TlyA family RNA methyltransferase n=1 Tax=unclassified Leucobacter TaxID=2621730 RepID=UPI00165E0FC0|nr:MULTISPECIES: TlyA family RNA methyltransferase [unclassified Leucobacter]MBC9944399.1 TlyA family RNA methyltransferase [Leucobacter sp. cx-328]